MIICTQVFFIHESVRIEEVNRRKPFLKEKKSKNSSLFFAIFLFGLIKLFEQKSSDDKLKYLIDFISFDLTWPRFVSNIKTKKKGDNQSMYCALNHLVTIKKSTHQITNKPTKIIDFYKKLLKYSYPSRG